MSKAPLPATLSKLDRVLVQATPDRIVLAVTTSAALGGFAMGFHALAHIRAIHKVIDQLVIETGGNIYR